MAIGNTIGWLGTKLGLPEFGISEMLGGTKKGTATFDVRQPATYGSGSPAPINWATDPAGAVDYGTPTTSADLYGGAGGEGTGSLGGATSPASQEAAYWAGELDSLNRLLQSTNTQRDQGLTRIADSFNLSKGRTEEDRARADAQYDTQRQDSMTGRLGALGKVDANARNTHTGLQRLLGLRGAGVSSTAQIAAPNAIARHASGQRSGVIDTFGRNLRDIDTADTETGSLFERALQDLQMQRQGKEEDFTRGILGQQNALSAQLANAAAQKSLAEGGSYESANAARAPYQSAISDRLNQLDNLFNQYRTPTYNQQQVNARTPELAGYTVDNAQLSAQRENPNIDRALLPYLSFLRDREQKRLI